MFSGWLKERGLVIGCILVVVWILMMAFDKSILLSERKIAPGQSFLVEDYGDLGKNKQSSLVCSYFNGRKIIKTVYWYSASNIMGRDSCPFLKE